jgi:hypothetical protein
MESLNYFDTVTRHWQLVLFVIAAIMVLWLAFTVARRVVNRRHLLRRNMVWLEITPPANIAKTPEATEQLFSVIHGARSARQWKEKLYDRSPVTSFEITSTRKDGIRYLVQIEKSRSKNIQKTITSYIPDSKVREVEHDDTVADKVIEFKETGHYVLPLTLTSAFEQHDPLSYITGAMTELEDGERITLQLVATPIRSREAEILSHKILGNENILQEVSGRGLSSIGRFTGFFGKAASGLTDLVGEVYMGTTSSYKSSYNSKAQTTQQQAHTTNRDRPARTLSAFELELMETMHRKVTQPLFRVNLHVLVKSSEAGAHIVALKSALDGYSVPPYQSLKARMNLPFFSDLLNKASMRRLPSLLHRSSIVLASSELASLYHFPSSQISKTDNLVTSLSHTLPAPLSLKSGNKLDVVVGENQHHGTTTPIGLTESERERHQYIIGGTGNGKTTMLQYQIVQDMQNGKGVAIVDPHGDMAETLLRYVPSERVKDVVYFNPDDLEYPIGLNLLELTPGLTGNDLLREKDIITESVISVFRKIFSEDDSGGHRIEYVLRNAIQTALTLPDATLFTIFDLLNDPKHRNNVIKRLDDKNLINFWKNELGKAGGMQQVKMAAGITAKIGRFLFSASAKQILEQPKSTIDFDDILNSGKILICNFSKGLLGEDTSELFGITVLAKLQLASLRRARLSQTERRAFYLYVDEFQNFATTSFVQMLSEARKYKLFLTMAEQSTSQQKDQQMVNIILANVGTVICFRTGNPQDERMLLPLFSPFIEEGEISNLPAYNFYAKLSAIHAQEPLSGQTLLLANEGNSEVRAAVIKHSQAVYAKKQEINSTEQPAQKMPTTEKTDKSKKQSTQKITRAKQDKSSTIKTKPPGF